MVVLCFGFTSTLTANMDADVCEELNGTWEWIKPSMWSEYKWTCSSLSEDAQKKFNDEKQKSEIYKGIQERKAQEEIKRQAVEKAAMQKRVDAEVAEWKAKDAEEARKLEKVFKNTKRHDFVSFIDQVYKLAPKDDFETKEMFLKRIKVSFGGDNILLKYPVGREGVQVKYDIDQQIMNIYLHVDAVDGIYKKFEDSRIAFNIDKNKISHKITDGMDKEDYPVDVVKAKEVKQIENYGFEVYAFVNIDDSIPKSKDIMTFGGVNRVFDRVNVEKIIIFNKKLNIFEAVIQ